MDPILLSVADGIARLRFNRPEQLNAIDLSIADGFRCAMVRIADDPSIRVVTLSGEGRAFIAGGDLSFLRRAGDRAEAAGRLIDPMHDGLKILRKAGVLTLAVVHGPAAGAGMSLALISDFVVASEEATFNMAYNQVAASPDCGGSWALPRLVGARRALELTLLGATLSAAEALQIGLINRVVPKDVLHQSADAFAERLAALPIGAALRTRSLLESSYSTGFEDQLDFEQVAFRAGATDPDFVEALEAFQSRRQPVFSRRRT